MKTDEYDEREDFCTNTVKLKKVYTRVRLAYSTVKEKKQKEQVTKIMRLSF